MKTHFNRRMFMGTAGAGVLVVPGRSGRAAPSERVRIAVIGLRNRGTDLTRMFAANPHAEVVAVCDVDDAMFAKPVKAVEKIAGNAPRVEKDFRRLLDDKSIDAVTIATPDHWHALLTVLACQAGKDVYVEKPASHNVVEGRRMVEAARKYDRVVQLGTQQRSTPHVQEAIEHVRSGALGKVSMARAWCHQKRVNIGHGQPATGARRASTMPCGKGLRPIGRITRTGLHYNWHWFWHWGTGELGNNGIHGVDVARWGLGVDAPITVSSAGGKFVFRRRPGDARHADRHLGIPPRLPGLRTPDLVRPSLEGSLVRRRLSGRQGHADHRRQRLAGRRRRRGQGQAARRRQAQHVQNFLDCVKSRRKPNADIEIGHLSTRLCLLGNIAHRTGKKLTFDAATRIVSRPRRPTRCSAREYSSRFEMPSHV